MTTIDLITEINAPIELCFDLSLSIDLESESGGSRLKAVAGVTSGSIGLNERVKWRSSRFGLPIYHLTEITILQRPEYFQDAMIKGLFRHFTHDHFFSSPLAGRTLMRDSLSFSMPSLMFGVVSERLIVLRQLRALLIARNLLIRTTAERTFSGTIEASSI